MYDNTEPVAGQNYSDDWWEGWLNKQLTGVSDEDILGYLEDNAYNPESNVYADFSSAISDPKMLSDFQNAKTAAVSKGDTNTIKWLDQVFKYGEKAIAAGVAAGWLDGPRLAASGYSNITQDADGTVRIGQNKVAVQAAPLPQKKVFSLDFSSPTVIIVTFVVVMLLAYFLFFNKKKSKR